MILFGVFEWKRIPTFFSFDFVCLFGFLFLFFVVVVVVVVACLLFNPPHSVHILMQDLDC